MLLSSDFVGDTNPPLLDVLLEVLCKGLELPDKGSDILLRDGPIPGPELGRPREALSPRSKLLFKEFEVIIPPILLGHRCCSINRL